MHDAETNTTRLERVGAGGWSKGVRLAVSNDTTQEINRINVERYIKRERRKKEKREREEKSRQMQEQIAKDGQA